MPKRFFPMQIRAFRSLLMEPSLCSTNRFWRAGWQLPDRMALTRRIMCWVRRSPSEVSCSSLRRGSECASRGTPHIVRAAILWTVSHFFSRGGSNYSKTKLKFGFRLSRICFNVLVLNMICNTPQWHQERKSWKDWKYPIRWPPGLGQGIRFLKSYN